MRNIKAFTLIELMVVILIVGILAAASVPLMRGRVDSAKWAEANATAGTIRSAVRVAFAEGTVAEDEELSMSNEAHRSRLGFNAADLTGTYFGPGDYKITAVDGNGIATVTATSTGGGNKPAAATYTLSNTGTWSKN